MHPAVITVAIALGSLAFFAACYGIALLATRAARPRPAAATPDLGEEPPAVVNLLTNGWELNEDAVEGTLLDLAARRYIELRQPGSDPRQTTVHLREPARSGPGLTPYEQRVLDRVRGLAVGGVVPISALTFRDEDQEKGWERRFRKEVTADAQARGLSRRRFTGAVIGLLELAAALTALGLAGAVAHWESWAEFNEDSQRGNWLPVGFMAFVMLGASVSAITGQRDTPAGVDAAHRWLGVRQWLRGHEEFAHLPPASVMVWDRYLAYGAALGTTHLASDVLDLGMADRKRVWSSYGGNWHRVRVRYPRPMPRHGLATSKVFTGGLIRLALGIGLLLLRSELLPRADLPGLLGPDTLDITSEPDQFTEIIANVLLYGGILLIALGGYRLVRGLIAVSTIRTITGEVLWLDGWRHARAGGDGPRVATLYYLAIDDGTSDKTTAWALPPGTAPGLTPGDTVTVRVMPWTRRVLNVQVQARGQGHTLAEAQAREDAADGTNGHNTYVGLDATGLVTAEEVSRALGTRMRADRRAGAEPTSFVRFHDERDDTDLSVHVFEGMLGRLVWRARANRGVELHGIGDKARADNTYVVARAGKLTVLIEQITGTPNTRGLAELTQLAADRAPERVRPPVPELD